MPRRGRRRPQLVGSGTKYVTVPSTLVQRESKLTDVVGLCLNPLKRPAVFSSDERTTCQALDRTEPSLPIKPGRGRTLTHDYKRNGAVDPFAAMPHSPLLLNRDGPLAPRYAPWMVDWPDGGRHADAARCRLGRV
jgi:hypothetical protein